MELRFSHIMACRYYYFVVWIQLCCKRSEAYLNITLKYFSWIRVKLEKSHDIIELKNNISIKELKYNLIKKDPIYEEIFKDNSIKYFLNLIELNDENQKLNDGDVLAFLPPVTGG